jgi:O-methyltransferase
VSAEYIDDASDGKLSREKAYLDLLKQSITASLFPESSWLIVKPEGRKGIAGFLKSIILRTLSSRGLIVVKKLKYDAVKREEGRDWPMFGYSMIGHRRLENIEHCLRSVVARGIEGDFVECGVWRGGAAIYAKGVLNMLGSVDRQVWLADSFEGMPIQSENDLIDPNISNETFLSVSLDQVKDNLRIFGMLDEKVSFIKGWFSESLPAAQISKIAVLRLDGDYYSSTMDALSALFDRVSVGGYVIVDDYGDFESCRRAVNEFCANRGVSPELVTIDSNGVYWQKE